MSWCCKADECRHAVLWSVTSHQLDGIRHSTESAKKTRQPYLKYRCSTSQTRSLKREYAKLSSFPVDRKGNREDREIAHGCSNDHKCSMQILRQVGTRETANGTKPGARALCSRIADGGTRSRTTTKYARATEQWHDHHDTNASKHHRIAAVASVCLYQVRRKTDGMLQTVPSRCIDPRNGNLIPFHRFAKSPCMRSVHDSAIWFASSAHMHQH